MELVIEHTCWLADHGVLTPAPLLLDGGGRMLIKDNLAWMLMPYVEGGWLPSDSSSLYELGKAQAQLHGVPIHNSIPTTLRKYQTGHINKIYVILKPQSLGSFSYLPLGWLITL